MATRRALRTLLLLAAASHITADQNAQKPIGSDQHEAIGEPAAQLVLYPGSRVHPDDLNSQGKKTQQCHDDDPKLPPTTIDLQVDTCISGEYYLQDNLKITKTPVCSDGSKPSLRFYRRRGCAGEPALVTDDAATLINDCLWSKQEQPNPSYYWSLVLSCSTAETLNPDDWKHKEATTTIAHQILGGVNGDIGEYTFKPCVSDPDGGPDTPHTSTRAVDVCWWPLLSSSSWSKFTHIWIQNAPICANGTRARLARLEDIGVSDRAYMNSNCNGGKITLEEGLIDINDEDIGKCISVQNLALTRGGTANAKGVMFYCDGLQLNSDSPKPPKTEKKQTSNGIVSHNECKVYPSWGWNSKDTPPARRPTTWMDMPAETCIDLHDNQPLRLLKLPDCSDGSPPLMAKWSRLGCHGAPDKVGGISASLGSRCRTFHGSDGTASYSFWCDNTSPRSLQKPSKSDPRAVYSTDTCEPKDGWWTPERHAGLAPTVNRIAPDTCIAGLSRDTEWVVHGSAVCPNGKQARLAFWEGKRDCFGKPSKIREVRKGDLGKCVEACGTSEDWTYRCSWAFWCKGREEWKADRGRGRGGTRGRW